jgi:hypothetical protein
MAIDFKTLRRELVFTHQDFDTGKITIIAIERLMKSNAYRLRPKVSIPVEQDQARYFYENRGIERHRLSKFFGVPIRDPVTLLKWGDGSDLLADGNHRYVAAALKGESCILAKILPRSVWAPFIVNNIPEEFDGEAFERYKSGWSGIPA